MVPQNQLTHPEWQQEALRERKHPPRLVWWAWNSLVGREITTPCVEILKIVWLSTIPYSVVILINTNPENRKIYPVSKEVKQHH